MKHFSAFDKFDKATE